MVQQQGDPAAALFADQSVRSPKKSSISQRSRVDHEPPFRGRYPLDGDRYTFAAAPQGKRVPVSIKRVSPSEGRLVINSGPLRNARFFGRSDALVCEQGSRRVALLLDHFDVNTEVDAKQMCVVFKLRHHSKFRPLREGLSSLEKTKHPTLMSRVVNAVEEIVRDLPAERVE